MADELVGLDCYDAGLMGNGGGGDVDWWQDYIRCELDRAHDFYQQQHEATITRLTAENARQAAEIEGLRAASKPLLEVCYRLDAIEELPWQIDGSMLDALSEALELKYPVIWTPEQVEMLKARQDSPMHPYTCGGDRTDELHRAIAEEDGTEPGQLYPTVRGWKCPACDYRQFWAHETGGPDAARKALHDPT